MPRLSTRSKKGSAPAVIKPEPKPEPAAPEAPAPDPAGDDDDLESKCQVTLTQWSDKILYIRDVVAAALDLWGYKWPWGKSQIHLHSAKVELEVLLHMIGINPLYQEGMFSDIRARTFHEKLKLVLTKLTFGTCYRTLSTLPRYVTCPRACSDDDKQLTKRRKTIIKAFTDKLDDISMVLF